MLGGTIIRDQHCLEYVTHIQNVSRFPAFVCVCVCLFHNFLSVICCCQRETKLVVKRLSQTLEAVRQILFSTAAVAGRPQCNLSSAPLKQKAEGPLKAGVC